jgi:oligopeptide transport system substrate-binding protein
MKKHMYGAIGVMAATGLLMTGCGTTSSNGSTSSVKQEITMDLLTEPPTLDPAKANDTTSGWVLDQVMEGLTYLGSNNQVEPGIAKSWDVSGDGTVYTFHLRDAKWTSGDPVTAGDFVYSMLHTLDPNTGSQFASYLYYIKGAQAYNTGHGSKNDVGVKALDDHTLQVTLKTPTPFFLNLTSFWPYFPVDEKVATSNPNWAANASTYVSDGPFKLSDWEHQQKLVLEKNPNYWNAGAIKLDKVTALIVNDSNTQYQMFQSKQLDMDTQPPLDVTPKLIQDGKAKVFPFTGTFFLVLNTAKAPFNNEDIRKAFALSIDRNQLVKDVLQGGQKPAYALVPPGIPGQNGDFRSEGGDLFKENVAMAKQLLAEGLKQEGLTQLPPITFEYNTLEANQKIAEALQQMWQQNLGVKVQLQNMEWKVYLDTLKKGNYQFGRLGWIDVYMDPSASLDLLKSTFGSNYTNWKNPQYDQLVNAAESTTNTAVRMQEMHKAESILGDQMPIIPIYFYTNVLAFQDDITGIVVHPNAAFPDMRYLYVK